LSLTARGSRPLIPIVVLGVTLWSGTALGQAKPASDERGKVVTQEKVAGEVVKVDMAQGKLSVREADGKIHEFQASPEALKDFKVGERIEAKLREAPAWK
jgi:hypothetical protein